MIRSFLIFLWLGAPLACSQKSTNEIRIQLSADPVTLDPSIAEDGLSYRILPNLMEGLIGYDSQGNLIQRAAESWTVSKDGLKWEFTLRKGAQWSDGQPVTAEDFVTGLKRSLAPETASKLAPVFSAIKKNPFGVRAENGKLILELDRPAPYLLKALALSQTYPQRKDVLEAHGGKWPLDAPTNGPYRIEKYRLGQDILLEPQKTHPLAQGAHPIRAIIVQDEATARNLFDQGRLDVLMRFPQQDFPRLRSQGVLRIDPFFATYYIAFNVRKAPFNQVRWRQAVAGAIRKEELTRALEMGERSASSWLPPELEGGWAYRDDSGKWSVAVKEIQQKIRIAKEKPSVTLGFDSSGRNSMVVEKIQGDLKSVLGLEARLENSDWKTYVRSLSTDPAQMYRYGWMTPFHDPILYLQVFVSKNPNNYTGWSDARYDRLVTEIEQMDSGPERVKKITEAQNILLYEAAVVVPLYHYVQVHAVAPRIHGFAVNPFSFAPYWEWRVK